MSVWILVIWFSSSGNYAYIPTVVGEFPTKWSCSDALRKFKEMERRRPDGICLEKPLKR